MNKTLCAAVYLVLLVVLLWPSSRVGGAVLSVTGGLGSVLRSGAGQVMGGAA